MDRLQYLLSKFAEEACEVSQAVLLVNPSALAGQVDFDHPVLRPIYEEINDLMAVVEMLNSEFGFGYRATWISDDSLCVEFSPSRFSPLQKLAMSANQLAQTILKTQQFGLETLLPEENFTTNQRCCHRYLNMFVNDLKDLCADLSCTFHPDQELIVAKKEKVNRFARMSNRLGALTISEA